MMVQTAVIQIDGTHHRLLIIADKHLGMDKAGGVFIKLHTCPDQRLIVCFGQCISNLLVRDTGQNDFHIHPSLCRINQGGLQLIIQDQVGRHNVHIASGTIQDVHIHLFAYLFSIQGAIPVGHYIALRTFLGEAESGLLPFGLLYIQIPHLQKHQGKAPDSLPL